MLSSSFFSDSTNLSSLSVFFVVLVVWTRDCVEAWFLGCIVSLLILFDPPNEVMVFGIGLQEDDFGGMHRRGCVGWVLVTSLYDRIVVTSCFGPRVMVRLKLGAFTAPSVPKLAAYAVGADLFRLVCLSWPILLNLTG